MTETTLPTRTSDGLIAGVSSGLSRHLRVDVSLVRIAFAVGALAWGIGALAYLVLWVLMPPEGEHYRDVGAAWSAARDRVEQGVTDVTRRARTIDAPTVASSTGRVGGALVGVGGLVLLSSLGAFSWLTAERALGAALCIAGAAVLLGGRSADGRTSW